MHYYQERASVRAQAMTGVSATAFERPNFMRASRPQAPVVPGLAVENSGVGLTPRARRGTLEGQWIWRSLSF